MGIPDAGNDWVAEMDTVVNICAAHGLAVDVDASGGGQTAGTRPPAGGLSD
jgi:hypothetical protein